MIRTWPKIIKNILPGPSKRAFFGVRPCCYVIDYRLRGDKVLLARVRQNLFERVKVFFFFLRVFFLTFLCRFACLFFFLTFLSRFACLWSTSRKRRPLWRRSGWLGAAAVGSIPALVLSHPPPPPPPQKKKVNKSYFFFSNIDRVNSSVTASLSPSSSSLCLSLFFC